MKRSIHYKDINEIKERMNKSAAVSRPFLFAVNFEMTEGFFVDNPLEQSDILFEVRGEGNKPKSAADFAPPIFNSCPLPYSTYKAKFDIVHNRLQRGDSFLTNLTIKTPIEISLTLRDIFEQSNTPYLLYLPGHFVSFSPERFVKIAGGIISSNPMKGTIDADIPNAENIILNDFKETAEHNTIVDLIRNDLSIISSNVHVKRYRYIDRIRTNRKDILQVSSEIEGKLPENYLNRLGDIFFSLLPAGSICGAPKQATLDIIRTAEGENRGYYTGVFGYFDGKELDSAVLIRYVENSDGKSYFRSGGGITAYSKCEDEYQEVLNKIYLPFV